MNGQLKKLLMKKIICFLLILVLLTCCKNPEIKVNKGIKTKAISNKNDKKNINNSWIFSFEKFKQAILNDEINIVKPYLQYPMTDGFNNVWSLVFYGQKVGIEDKNDEFTSDDLEKYYFEVFPSSFKIALKTYNIGNIESNKDVLSNIFLNEQGDEIQLSTLYDSNYKGFVIKLLNLTQIKMHKEQDSKFFRENSPNEDGIYSEPSYDEIDIDNKYEEISYEFKIQKDNTVLITSINKSNF